MTCPDHIPSYLCDPNIDPEIYELYISHNEQNWCTSRLACGCYCPNPCGNLEHCHVHFYRGDFKLARTHTNFSNTSQRLTLPTFNTDTNINELFDMLPPEILMKIVRIIHFADLKQLYIMRIPAILALVQGDLLFNYSTLFYNPAATSIRVYKFESDYTRGLRAIDVAISQTRVSASYVIAASFVSFEQRERERTNDRRHYNIDCEAHDMDHREWTRADKKKYLDNLKFKPAHVTDPEISHCVGHRRLFPGVLDDHKMFQILTDFAYDDFFAKNKAETTRIIKDYRANEANYPLVSRINNVPWS